MYIKNLSELMRTLEDRRNRRVEIQERLEGFLQAHYGLNGYQGLVKANILSDLSGGVTRAVLARQIASMNAEEVSCMVGARILGLRPVTLTFFRDSFTAQNHDKHARVRIPWCWRGRNGKIAFETSYIAREQIQILERKPMSYIQTTCGLSLPKFHLMLRKASFGESFETSDVSSLHSETLRLATRKPEKVFEFKRGYDVVSTWSDDKPDGILRPPASWYYPLYLSWFLDGDMILLETYENPEGGVPEARKLFEQTMLRLKAVVGVLPIVVQIPPLNQKLLTCNRHLFESDRWHQEIKARTPNPEGLLFVDWFQSIADAVISYH